MENVKNLLKNILNKQIKYTSAKHSELCQKPDNSLSLDDSKNIILPVDDGDFKPLKNAIMKLPAVDDLNYLLKVAVDVKVTKETFDKLIQKALVESWNDIADICLCKQQQQQPEPEPKQQQQQQQPKQQQPEPEPEPKPEPKLEIKNNIKEEKSIDLNVNNSQEKNLDLNNDIQSMGIDDIMDLNEGNEEKPKVGLKKHPKKSIQDCLVGAVEVGVDGETNFKVALNKAGRKFWKKV